MGLLMRQALLDALEAKYEAEIAAAHAIIKIFLENPVGIGEHPQHLDELDKQFGKIAEAEDKLKALESFQLERLEI
jgi:D-serine deaminase-like pyridoxal phosphate-dependent protein